MTSECSQLIRCLSVEIKSWSGYHEICLHLSGQILLPMLPAESACKIKEKGTLGHLHVRKNGYAAELRIVNRFFKKENSPPN